ncbi:MAG: flagellar type III secretion system pore protein FliP [Alphaproteobacteria bacterium]|nr:flagellar type III secretion system pore protein FliP [Alphaproteobacteria bacterium]
MTLFSSHSRAALSRYHGLAGVCALIALVALVTTLMFAPHPACAQALSVDLGGDANSGSVTGKILQMVLLVGVLSLAPSLLVMVTSFTRIIVVLSFLRSALGLQQTPPTPVLVSLALFLTGFIMMNTFEQAYKDGIAPLMREEIKEDVAMERTAKPFQHFMLSQVREKDLGLFMDLGKIPPPTKAEDTPYRALVPAFMISELRRSFEIGFLIFLPFLMIDMLVSSTLMAMGMMMLPPVMISLPFKLIFFVMIDGWYLICGSLVKSFGAV